MTRNLPAIAGLLLTCVLVHACGNTDNSNTLSDPTQVRTTAQQRCEQNSMTSMDANDITLCYTDTGEGDPVVLIHGLGSSTRDWENQIPALSESHRVLSIDLRGHGFSDKPNGPYSIEMFASDLQQLLENETRDGAHLVGISMGAMVAVQYALDFPQLVKSVVAVNAPPDMRPNGIKQNLMVWQRKILVNIFGMKKVGEVLADRLLPGVQHEAARATFAQRWAENDIDAYRHSFNAILEWSVVDRLSEFEAPLLVIAAEQDYLPLSGKQVYLDKVPNAKLKVIKNSRHATPVEHPDVFNQEVLSWLREVQP